MNDKRKLNIVDLFIHLLSFFPLFLLFVIPVSAQNFGYNDPDLLQFEVQEPTAVVVQGNSSFNETYLNNVYLRLDATNDPVTGRLDVDDTINVSSGGNVSIMNGDLDFYTNGEGVNWIQLGAYFVCSAAQCQIFNIGDVDIISTDGLISLIGNILLDGPVSGTGSANFTENVTARVIVSEGNRFCNATRCATMQDFLNDTGGVTFNNTNVAYLNNSQTFTANNTFTGTNNNFTQDTFFMDAIGLKGSSPGITALSAIYYETQNPAFGVDFEVKYNGGNGFVLPTGGRFTGTLARSGTTTLSQVIGITGIGKYESGQNVSGGSALGPYGIVGQVETGTANITGSLFTAAGVRGARCPTVTGFSSATGDFCLAGQFDDAVAISSGFPLHFESTQTTLGDSYINYNNTDIEVRVDSVKSIAFDGLIIKMPSGIYINSTDAHNFTIHNSSGFVLVTIDGNAEHNVRVHKENGTGDAPACFDANGFLFRGDAVSGCAIGPESQQASPTIWERITPW